MQFEVSHQCLPQRKLTQPVARGRVVDSRHLVNVGNASYLNTNDTHIVACMVLGHPNKVAEITF